MGTQDAIRFEEELPEVADASTADVAGGNLITGQITRCGQPAAGIRIEAIGILTIGLEIDSRPCVKSAWTACPRLGDDNRGRHILDQL